MKKIRLEIKGFTYGHSNNNAYILVLRESDGDRKLPIVIGSPEAQAIAFTLEKKLKTSRPMTHDVFKNTLDRFQVDLKEIIIHKLEDGLFYSSLICERDGIQEIIDSRTSDAIAMAQRFQAPIYTYPEILEQAGIYYTFEEKSEEYTEEPEVDLEQENFKDLELNTKAEVSKNPYANFSIRQLDEELQKMLKSENYEAAALLRDELKNRGK